jgi:uncharacterized protein YgbK (DUF1537 family)
MTRRLHLPKAETNFHHPAPGYKNTPQGKGKQMNEKIIEYARLFAQLPPEWPQDLLPDIQEKVHASRRKVIVLDDDPTGTQTVHAIAVLTDWPVELLAAEQKEDAPALYLLTNSRGMPLPQAQALNRETGRRIAEACRQSGTDAVVASRSDSTLRGHFPGEVEALAQGLGGEFDAWLIVPFFKEGGRYTIDDIHYVAEGENLVPAGQTEFARDKTFGYQASNLREWVAEKTGGRVPAAEVQSISLETLRRGGPNAVTRQLLELPKGSICFVNAASYRDLEVLVLGLLEAEDAGKRYLYRCAASFVRVRAGIAPRPLLTREDFSLPSSGAGLVIAGSYVPKTSAQLDTLFGQTRITPIEVSVPQLLDETRREEEIARVIKETNHLLGRGQDSAIYTSRALISTGTAEDNLAIGQIVSDSLVKIIRGVEIRPRYLLAKGGITSSVIASEGLRIRRALVLGQVLPGVPAWQSGPESRWPGMTYIVFPGNVGGADALARVVTDLSIKS